MKYIDADKLTTIIEERKEQQDQWINSYHDPIDQGISHELTEILSIIASLQQEQPNDVCAEIKEYYGKELPFEDEKTKAAYHFFSAGCSFELRKIDEEREDYITALIDNYKRGMKMGYQNALLALKDGKIESSPIMTEFLTKLLGSGFGFGPNVSIVQEQPEIDLREFINKIDSFKARYKHPESISIKGAMAFMARMFYQYPNTARDWYESLPKTTMDNAKKEE